MKSIFNYIITGIVLSLSFIACKKGYIDPISKVAVGNDEQAPTVEIVSPSADIQYPAITEAANFDFKFNVSDDIELSKVDISLDGNLLESYTSFIDYRGISGSYTYADLGLGAHTFEVVATDLSGKSTTKSFAFNITKYNKVLESETLYVPFNPGGDYKDLISFVSPAVTGSPGTTGATGGHNGAAYQGAADAYLSFPIAGLYGTNNEMSFSFWYKLNNVPDRSGLVVIGNDDDVDTRNQGFRLFRENADQSMTINVGTGAADSWIGAGSQTSGIGVWKFITVTISSAETKIYVDGVQKAAGTYTSAMDLTGCTSLVLGSGGPTFAYWDHKSDLSLYDEFRVFNTVLTPDDIQLLMQ
ncbi:LamG-like jellyroll fold domain-containing protein [Agriterribacter sp.]|uniref:LamG-like jellyroll fold domain-containing protein n=1 Tax=Agriterribacter sp. TaxID=2821509 RepID=UPI002CD56D15|nr:LamG-like jellyroll fold domain-containing protein [Agriterribacter sp.]HRO48003.1 Ig-like domain-containing protein [Agriterribacter sp.]HRQ16226.1 Ig-like domain-containing protein [Agriterribacter sp.]